MCVLQAIQELKMTECKLLKIISATDRTCKQQKRELDKILNERDVLGSQLVRRNDEMSLLYEKTRLLTMLMNKGYVAYYQRLEVGVCGVCVCALMACVFVAAYAIICCLSTVWFKIISIFFYSRTGVRGWVTDNSREETVALQNWITSPLRPLKFTSFFGRCV